MNKILVVDDDQNILNVIKLRLEANNYCVATTLQAEEAVKIAKNKIFDLALLDFKLASSNGIELMEELHQIDSEIPIIILTARSHEAEKVLGLEMGADDYVTKPFSPLELRARIKAQLRRSQISQPSSYAFSSLVINLDRMEVLDGNRPIELTTLEFKLLTALIQNAGRVLSRDRILDLVWGTNAVVTDRVIDTHIANLRNKLEPNGSTNISSIRGIGYRFDP